MTYQPTVKELRALVGNPDVYAEQGESGAWFPVEKKLTGAVLRQHLLGEITVGTYIVKPPDQARTLVFDIDLHGSTAAGVESELSAVLDVLNDVGLAPYRGVEESGGGGYHVWLVAEDYMPAATLYRLGRGIRTEADLPALEVFPKQTEVKKLGNLVKLPGGVHRKTGNPNNLINGAGYMYTLCPVSVLEAAAMKYPEPLSISRGSAPTELAYPCVANIQAGVEGNRNIHLFHLATMLRKWSISDANVQTIVERANEASSGGGLDDNEMEALLDNSRSSGPVCGQLDDNVGCGDLCILASGLKTRPGSLKFAAETEKVVMEVVRRTESGTVELAHPDAVQALANLIDPKAPPRRKESGS